MLQNISIGIKSDFNNARLGLVQCVTYRDHATQPQYGELRPIVSTSDLSEGEWLLSDLKTGCYGFKTHFPGMQAQYSRRTQEWFDGKWQYLGADISAFDSAGNVVTVSITGVPSDFPVAMLDREIRAGIARLTEKIELRNRALSNAPNLSLAA